MQSVWTFILVVTSLGVVCSCETVGESKKWAASPNPTFANSMRENAETTKGHELKSVDNKLIKQDGWHLPELRTAIVLKEKASVTAGEVRMYRTEYELHDDFIVKASRQPVNRKAEDHDTETENWAVRFVIVFESDEKPFCYYLRASKVMLNADGSIRDRVASAIGLNVYDSDGDGLFETLEFIPLFPEIPSVPRWVK